MIPTAWLLALPRLGVVLAFLLVGLFWRWVLPLDAVGNSQPNHDVKFVAPLSP